MHIKSCIVACGHWLHAKSTYHIHVLLSEGGGTVTSLFCWAISVAMVCVPHLSHTRCCIAFPLLQISHPCVFRDILSAKAVYRVLCPFFRPKMFSPGDRAWYLPLTHAWCTCVGHCRGPFTKWAAVLPHSVHTPSWGPLQWIMRVLNGIPLQPPPPPRGETVTREGGGDFKGGRVWLPNLSASILRFHSMFCGLTRV